MIGRYLLKAIKKKYEKLFYTFLTLGINNLRKLISTWRFATVIHPRSYDTIVLHSTLCLDAYYTKEQKIERKDD